MHGIKYTCERCGAPISTARRTNHSAKHQREDMRALGPVAAGDTLRMVDGSGDVVVVTFSDQALRVRRPDQVDAWAFTVGGDQVRRP